ncbi:MAG: universal stress protein [Anaerolineaceae bacterium]|nr:universal stress protein [Anaerolineaceae bacterium]
MFALNKILVPLDGSELAEWAIEPALELAQSTKGEVILLRSLIPVYTTMPVVAGEYEWAWPEYAREQVRVEVKEYLEAVRERFSQPGVTLSTLAVEGDAASAILDTANARQADLIVMSTHGWSGTDKLLLGSVTERILHQAACPVFVVRSPRSISRMMLTLDGSRLAETAVEPGLAIANAFKARATLLSVNEPITVSSKMMVQQKWLNSLEGQQAQQQSRSEKEQYLRDVAARYEVTGGHAAVEVIDGPAVDKILEFADLHGIDLIVMSTHGRTGLRRWLYGSVTAKVMRRTTSSMLIIRPATEAFN